MVTAFTILGKIMVTEIRDDGNLSFCGIVKMERATHFFQIHYYLSTSFDRNTHNCCNDFVSYIIIKFSLNN